MLKKKLLVLFALIPLFTTAYAAADNPHIMTLAGSCAACHGTNGLSLGGTPVLAGLDAGYFVKRMHEYQKQTDSTEVMPQNVRGLTAEEILQLGQYFAEQPRAYPHAQEHSLKARSQTMRGK
ncbi:c-type cytochrome [Glaciimonas immobilis]|uniref:Cytochrome c553 n=1 Tax=Glaciimonas immobilis TaxID=728004 RepID=A0A840RST0_9BURK|nr:hypothetical protein [Glaciimonas immobilis]MBB5199529.1 cytochrome c553 [Glaciimonas immobilis]